MLGQRRIPSREGGIEVVVGELAVRMAEKGHQVTCLNRSRRGESRKRGIYRGVRLRAVRTIDLRGLAAVTSSVSAAVCAAFGKYDVVHFHGEGCCALIWLVKLTGKRCIVTVHGLDHMRSKWGRVGSAYIRLSERILARFADEIIVLSEGVRRYFRETCGRETVLIPNGVTPVRPLPAKRIRERFGLAGGDYILYVGRLVPEKGAQYLLAAYALLHTDKKLVIAGASADTDDFVRELKQAAAGDSRIVFTGFADGELLAELYGGAYLYVLPSDLEGMPLTLLEAMSAGCCCLVSDIEECAAVGDGHVETFRRGDVSDLARHLQDLLDDPARVRACALTASGYICERHRWEDITERVLRVYEGRKTGT